MNADGKYEKEEELIDIFGVSGIQRDEEVESEPVHDPCAPPSPKGAIFHTDDSDPLSSNDLWKDPVREPFNTGVRQSTNYELPYKSNDKSRSWWKWVNHPVVVTLTVLLILGCVVVFGGVPWIVGVGISIFLAPYWIIRRGRNQRYYNMDWDASANPMGLGRQDYRWWRIWW